MYSPTLGRFIERMPWWSVSTINSTPKDKIIKRGPFRNVVQVYEPQTKHLDAYDMASIDPMWTVIIKKSLKGGHGSYFDRRFGLYDFVKNDPANMVEPFSSPWAGPFQPHYPPIEPTPPLHPEDAGNPFDYEDDARKQAKGNDTSKHKDSLHHCIAICLFAKRVAGGGGVAATGIGFGIHTAGSPMEFIPGLGSEDWDSDIVSNRNGYECAASSDISCKCCCMLKQGSVP